MQLIKGESSHWINERKLIEETFQWQTSDEKWYKFDKDWTLWVNN